MVDVKTYVQKCAKPIFLIGLLMMITGCDFLPFFTVSPTDEAIIKKRV